MLISNVSNHETDSSKFPWWPQHKSADQPSSETGVEATNAEVTGPGMYTVGLKFNWQKAEGAIQFNLVLDNAESLFPGYYVKITDIRVNGKSIDHKPNLYGTFHDDPNAGFAGRIRGLGHRGGVAQQRHSAGGDDSGKRGDELIDQAVGAGNILCWQKREAERADRKLH